MAQLTARLAPPGITRIGSVLVLCLLLVSCGLGGDDEDPEPTATTASEVEAPAQPTEPVASPTVEDPFTLIPATPEASPGAVVEDVAEPEGTGEATPDVEAEAAVTQIAGASPQVATPETARFEPTATPAGQPGATPAVTTSNGSRTPEVNVMPSESTPVPGEVTTPEPGAADVPDEAAGNSFTGSDGTSGATSLPGESATPESGASPGATPERVEARVFAVSGCVVDNPPVFLGNDAAREVITELYFRAGPGEDCEVIQDALLEPGTALTILSEPVTRSDVNDGFEWVQVNVNGVTGWVAAEFIAPQNP